jgi:hypothetical protein
VRRLDAEALDTPLPLVAAAGGCPDLDTLLAELHAVLPAGVEPLAPLGGGATGLLWGLALPELEP